jgi:hypothetical protein
LFWDIVSIFADSISLLNQLYPLTRGKEKIAYLFEVIEIAGTQERGQTWIVVTCIKLNLVVSLAIFAYSPSDQNTAVCSEHLFRTTHPGTCRDTWISLRVGARLGQSTCQLFDPQ